MDKSFWIFRNPKQAVFCIVFLLLVVGCINVFSASYIVAQDMGDSYSFLKKYIICTLLGFGIIHVVRKIGYRRILQPRLLLLLYFGTAVALLAVFAFSSVKGAQRWIYLPGFSVQPSEIAKLVIIMICSSSLGEMLQRGERVSLFHGRSMKIFLLTLFYFLLIYIEPDLGTGAIVVGLMLGMFMIAGLSRNEIIGMLGLAAAGAVLLTVVSPYRRERIRVMFDPWLDPMGKGYQIVQAQTAIGSGSWFGTHWGQGTGKFFYLPESHTDFAFAIFSQENGFLGVLLIFGLFVFLGYIFARIAVRARREEGFLLASGVSFLIIGQAIANMAMVCGLLPVIGVPLVFISYGGSSMIISMAAIGLLLSVYDETVELERRERLAAEAPEKRRDNLYVTSERRWR